MSLNTAHANNGVLIHSGEAILLYSEHVTIEFSGQDRPEFRGTKNGNIYLTTHRLIFNAKKFEDAMKSFSFPFVCLNEVEVEQPMFGANYIRGKVRAQADGQFIGEAKFKMVFKSGGAIEFAQAMLRAAHMAQQNAHGAEPPPYTPPTGEWHPAPPPAYTPTPGYYGWLPSQVFPNGPNPNAVYMHDSPPPYPGIIPSNPPPSYGQHQQGYSQPGYPNANPPSYPNANPPSYPNGNQGYPSANPGYPSANPSYPSQPSSNPSYQPQPGYPPQSGYAQSGWNPNQQGGYPTPGAYPPQPNMYPQVPNAAPYGNPAPGYPQGGFQQQPYPGYPPANGAAGGGFAPPPNSKEAEAAQSASNPQPNVPYAPPPGYNDPPPSYNSLSAQERKNQ